MPKKDERKLIQLEPEDIIEFFDMKYYENNLWYKRNDLWQSLSQYPNEGHRTTALIGLIAERYKYEYDNIPIEERKNFKIPTPKQQIQTGTVIGQTQLYHKVESIFKGIVFKNGYVKTDGKGFIASKSLPFTPVQIPHSYDPNIKTSPIFLKWMKNIAGGDLEVIKKYLVMFSYVLSSETLGVLMYLHGPGRVGKTEILQKLSSYVGRNNSMKVKSSAIFGKFSQTNGRFNLRGIGERTLLFMDEFIKNTVDGAGNTIKEIMNTSGFIGIENKGSNQTDTPNTHSWFAASNYYPKIIDLDQEVQERIVIAEFKEPELSEKEVFEFMEGDYIETIIPLLVDAYTNSQRYKNTRNKHLKIEEFQSRWLVSDDTKESEEIWASEQNWHIDQKPISEILEMYKADTGLHSNNVKMGLGLKRAGFKRTERKTRGGSRVYEYITQKAN